MQKRNRRFPMYSFPHFDKILTAFSVRDILTSINLYEASKSIFDVVKWTMCRAQSYIPYHFVQRAITRALFRSQHQNFLKTLSVNFEKVLDLTKFIFIINPIFSS